MTDRAASDEELESALLDAQAGDEGAFRTLYRDLQPRLLRYLRALVGTEAEDVAADAWLQIARDLGSFSGDYDRFRGWASTVARHRALDHLRRAGRRPDASVHIDELTDLVAADDTERDALERLSTGSAIALICGLPRDQAEAVLLRVVVGLDAKEAGRVLGKRSGAVRTAAYRGLRRLAERLDGPPAARPDESERGADSADSADSESGESGGPRSEQEAGDRQPTGAHGTPPDAAQRGTA
ncbi:RNA polymerase sigma factor [Actinomadura sp. 9N407]|uniref:RNA polymerase sigma factor n=1 Tax=Actinomadura sp. 9N407 TaxID=3375154 RepID=UPI0037B28DCE